MQASKVKAGLKAAFRKSNGKMAPNIEENQTKIKVERTSPFFMKFRFFYEWPQITGTNEISSTLSLELEVLM